MKKKFPLLLMTCVILMTGLSGCFSPLNLVDLLFGSSEVLQKVTPYSPWRVSLNERQKQLLREVGLPEDYYELNHVQQDAIVKIENSICYMEEKHPEDRGKFSYSGFFGNQVTLKVPDSCPEFHVIVDIYSKNGKRVYKDNYENYRIRDAYKAELSVFLDKHIGPGNYIIVPNITKVKETGDTAVNRVIGVPAIVVKDAGRERMAGIALNYAKWLKRVHHKKADAAHFHGYSEEYFNMITEENYRGDPEAPWRWKELGRVTVSFSGDEPIEIRRHE